MRGFHLRLYFAFILLLASLVPATPAFAQLTGMALEVPPDAVGIQGHVRFGQWTPMRLTLTNQSAQPRTVVCRWVLEDADGDEVIYQRRATIDQTQNLWLYAPPRANQQLGKAWTVQVLDAETNEPLASRKVAANRQAVLHDDESVIGVMSSKSMGLQPYTTRDIAPRGGQTRARLDDGAPAGSVVRPLEHEDAHLDAEGTAPTDPAVPDSVKMALREWVRRGGHLVIVLPSVGQTWTDSLLADMLPADKEDMREVVDADLPTWLYDVRPSQPPKLQMTAFDIDDSDQAAVLLRDKYDNALVVAGRYGFGRVTLVGVDLADPRLAKLGLPEGRFRIWNTIFGWQDPAFTPSYIKAEQQANPPRMSRLNFRNDVKLDQFVPSQIAMRNTAAPAVLLAVLVFALYWILAGPVSYVVLRQRGQARHSWLIFVAVVAVFSVVAWGGAWMMQPRTASIAHFSIVDMDGQSGEVHTQSWLSLYLPRFDNADIKVGPGALGQRDTLSTAGLPQGLPGGGFPDPRTYDPPVQADAPYEMHVPFRSTAKQFQLDYCGPLNEKLAGVADAWVMPQGQPHIENQWPVGKLSHNLPGTLKNVLVVYCPGGKEMPWVWTQDDWVPKTILDVTKYRNQATRLVRRREQFPADRDWAAEGFLGELIKRKTGHNFADKDPARMRVADNVLVQSMEMLTFYAMLPPPDFRKVTGLAGFGGAVMYQRQIARSWDLSQLTAEPRLIVIGFLPHAPLPAPLTVDGDAVPSEGWTMVRWMYDL